MELTKQWQTISHDIPPVFDENSKILILGTLPSVKSRESHFFYGNPQNRFWRLLAKLFGCPAPVSVMEKKEFLLERHIAVWDVIAKCDIIGSSDSSIRNVVPANLDIILGKADIVQIFANGATAEKLYNKYTKPLTGREIIKLPSTSPANASFSLERLALKWKCINDFLIYESGE